MENKITNSLMFLNGEGEMPKRFQELDWSKTALGSVLTWPQSLRTAVGLMLKSRFPMFLSWGPKRVFLYNDAYALILGKKNEMALGQEFEIIWSEIWNDLKPLVDSVDKGEAVYLEDLHLKIHRNGFEEDTYFTFSYSPIFDESNSVAGLFCACVETTDRKRSEDALRSSELGMMDTLESMSDAFFSVDKNWIITQVNKRHELIVQKSRAEQIGKSLIDLWFSDPIYENSIYLASYKKAMQERIMVRFEDYYEPLKLWTEVRVYPKSDGGLAVFFTDISERKRQELVLEGEKKKLDTLVKDLEVSKLEAERANQTKSFFLANMSHEIRTPLAAILGFSSLLKDRTIDSEERDRYLDTIVRNGNSLTTIIDDILDLAKVEAGKLEIENISFSLYTLVNDVIDVFRDKARAKKIYLMLNIDEAVPSQICTDPTRLRQILVNLIGNAVKFTDHGGIRINVQADWARGNKTRISIDVKDTGIGLSEEQKEKLFMPFTQADNSMTRKFGGTGLGLALSQRLSQALSGEITISNYRVGNGCTFTLSFEATLSFSESSKPGKENNPSHEDSNLLQGVRVLVVDDSLDNQFLIERLLVKNGATVKTAADGEEGVTKALSDVFDVILMDIQMPKVDGYKAKEALDKAGYKKPVIALTAHAMAEERNKTTAAGFVRHLTKPLIAADLLNAVIQFGKVSELI